jgi:hypothetical protein
VPDRPGALGPVQLIVIAVEGGSFDRTVLDELRRLRERDAIRLLDLLFVAKDGRGDVVELEQSDFSADEGDAYGALIGALVGFVDTTQNGSLPHRDGVWFLADEIPAGTTAAIALLEHHWAVPLRDAIESAGDHDVVDRWIHRDDLAAIGVDRG